MKQTSRILLATVLALTMLLSNVIFSSAAAMEGATIGSEILPESNVHSVIDFNNNKLYANDTDFMYQTAVVPPESAEGYDNIRYMDTDLYVTPDSTTGKPLLSPTDTGVTGYQYQFDMFGGNGSYYAFREVTDKIDNPDGSNRGSFLKFSYDPAIHGKDEKREGNWGASDLSILTQKFVSEKVVASNKVSYVNLAYDYVEVSFDVYFHNPQGNFLVSLENDTNNESARFYLMIIDTEGNVYLRESSGSPSLDVSNGDGGYDRKIGKLNLDAWNTVSIAFYPHVGTVGYYDYWISVNGQELTRDGTMTYMSTIVDNASFLNQQTKIKFNMGASEEEPTALTYWALDNVSFESYDYLNEPDEINTRLPYIDFEAEEDNVIEDFTGALEGVTALADGTYAVNVSGAHIDLAKSAALAGISLDEYFLDFEIYGKLPVTLSLYDKTFAIPDGVLAANKWNSVSVRVEVAADKSAQIQVNGKAIGGDFVANGAPMFSIFPDETAATPVKVRNLGLRCFDKVVGFDSAVSGISPNSENGGYNIDIVTNAAAVVELASVTDKALKNYAFSFQIFDRPTAKIKIYGQEFTITKSLLTAGVWNTVTVEVTLDESGTTPKIQLTLNGQAQSKAFTYTDSPVVSILPSYKSGSSPTQVRNFELRHIDSSIALSEEWLGVTQNGSEYTIDNVKAAGLYVHLYKSKLAALKNDRVNNFFTFTFDLFGNDYNAMQLYGVKFAMPAGVLVANQWNTVVLSMTISEYNEIEIKVNGYAIAGEFAFTSEPVLVIYSNGNGMNGEQVRNLSLAEHFYKLKSSKVEETKDVWNTDSYSANAVINMGEKFTTINGNAALQFDKVEGASARDPQYQVQGSYTGDAFSLSLFDGGFAVKGQKVNLLLYRKNGNAYLSSDRVADTFHVTFEVYGNPDLDITIYGKTLGVPGLVAEQWNTVTVYVAPYNDTQDMVRVVCNGETNPEQINRTENPVLSFELPANEEVQIRNIHLYETVEKDVYYVTIGGEEVVLSEARTKYLRYQWEKRFTSADVLPSMYGTVDRKAVRPVGEVAFDTDTYYHKHNVTVASWGSTITPAVACDVNYWMTNKSHLDENGVETNTYLTGCADIYMENGAVVTQVYAQGNDGRTDIWHTSGVQYNFFKKDGVKSMKQDYIGEYFRVTLSFWYDSVTFPDAGMQFRFGAENSAHETSDSDPLGSRYMTGQKMFRVETTDAGPLLIISTDRYGVAREGEEGYRLAADPNYLLHQVTPSKDANGNYRTFDSHMFVTNPLADALPEGETTLNVELQEGWNTLELEYKKVHQATANDIRNNDDGSTTTFEMTHTIFEVRYAVNGDYVYHTPEDMEFGNLFYFDNCIDPTSQHMYLEITAPLHSIGTEMPTELERTKYRSLKLEFLHDEEIDVNSYEKGTETEDVIRSTDFVVNIEDDIRDLAAAAQKVKVAEEALAKATTSEERFQCENELRRAQLAYNELNAAITRRMVYAQKSGNVTFVDRNDRLLVDHLEDGSTAEVLYTFAEGEIGDVMTFDFSLYRGLLYDGSSAVTKEGTSPAFEVFVGNEVVMQIDENGVVRTNSIVAECKVSGWNNISVALEKMNGIWYLTAYVNGEIVSFRIVTGATEITNVGVRSMGDAGDSYRLDNMAVSTTNIPTSVIYMHPITYVVGEGEMSYDAGIGYHIVGDVQDTFPTVGAENALFEGWYYDQEFTSKANIVRGSYTKPVTLYAKYNYLVSYSMPDSMAGSEVKPPRSTVAYGDIAIPQISGVVEYWYAVVDGQDIYVKGGEMYNVHTNVNFVAVVAEGKAKADFAVSVLSIDLSDRYENISAGVKKAEALYALLSAEEKQDAQVVKYRSVLDNDISGEMEARKDMAEDYLAYFAILADKTKTYAERLEAYRQMDVYAYENNADGKTFRDYVDMTVPGVFEANSDLATHSRTLEKAKDACIQLVLAVEGYKKAQGEGKLSTMLQKFTYASLVTKAYNNCVAESVRYAVETYDSLSLADFVDVVLRKDNAEDMMKVIPTELLAGGITAYLAEAKEMIDGYNNTAAEVNGDLLGAHQVADSFTSGVYNTAAEGKVPAAIVALLDSFKEQLEALLGRS